jgi:hypothetical protein
MRRVVEKGIGERERARAHRRCRNRVRKLAGLRGFDGEFLELGCVSGEEGKRGEGGVSGLFIAEFAWRMG